jgi:hypothetical protein
VIRAFTIKHALTLLVALSVVFAPLAPVFAMVTGSGEAHAVHVAHDGDHRADGSIQADHGSKTCTQHDSGDGQCGNCCAHCLGAVSLFQRAYLPSHPVQTPVLSRLHSLVLVASPDRPPRLFSL